MRAAPTVSTSGTFSGSASGGTINSISTSSIGPDIVAFRVAFSANIGDSFSIRHTDTFDGDKILYDAEL